MPFLLLDFNKFLQHSHSENLICAANSRAASGSQRFKTHVSYQAFLSLGVRLGLDERITKILNIIPRTTTSPLYMHPYVPLFLPLLSTELLCIPECVNGSCVDGTCMCPVGYSGQGCSGESQVKIPCSLSTTSSV